MAARLTRGEASVFHRKSFSAKSFLAKSWRPTGDPAEPPATVFPGRPLLAPRRRERPVRRDRDDDVLMFLLR